MSVAELVMLRNERVTPLAVASRSAMRRSAVLRSVALRSTPTKSVITRRSACTGSRLRSRSSTASPSLSFQVMPAKGSKGSRTGSSPEMSAAMRAP